MYSENFLGFYNSAKVLLEILGACARILFVWLLWRNPPDQRCFMLKVITKLVTLIYLPFALAVVMAFGEASTLVFVGFHDSFFVALFFALLGIEGTLALPGGKRLHHFCLEVFFFCFLFEDQMTTDRKGRLVESFYFILIVPYILFCYVLIMPLTSSSILCGLRVRFVVCLFVCLFACLLACLLCLFCLVCLVWFCWVWFCWVCFFGFVCFFLVVSCSFVHSPVCLFLCFLFVYFFVYLFLNVCFFFVCSFVCLFVCLFVFSLFVRLFVCLCFWFCFTLCCFLVCFILCCWFVFCLFSFRVVGLFVCLFVFCLFVCLFARLLACLLVLLVLF